MKTLTKLAGFFLALALLPSAHAVLITYVGRQLDTGTNWRTAAVNKPLDLNGDNILGTDGYQVVNRPALLPAYVNTMTNLVPTTSSSGYVRIDDPLNPSAIFVTGTMTTNAGQYVSADLFRFTLNANAAGRTIRVGLLVDNLDNHFNNAIGLTLRQSNGAGATSPEVTNGPPFAYPSSNNRFPDWFFFDITGATNGDSFTIQGRGAGNGSASLGGVAFDSATVAWSFDGSADPMLDAAMTNYMALRTISRGALAVTRNGKLVFHRAYTHAPAGTAPTRTTNLFRIASLSKQFTAVGVLQLAQAGQLNLADTIGRLLHVTNAVDSRFTNVTVQQLLQHTGGWNREKSGGYDPMFYDTQISTALGLPLPTTPQMIIDYVQRYPLDFAPGTAQYYSNFGYDLLGRIIEAVSGQPYEQYIRNNVLLPAGIWDMQLGKALLTNALPAEVNYETATDAIVNSVMGANSPPQVPAPYGGFNLNSMDAHGGWVANAADLVRFSSSFDVMTNSPLLSSNWIRQMWSAPSFIPTNAIQYYADGWNVRSNYDAYIAWHDGALPGTYAFTARGDGICYAMVFNKRYSDVYPATNDDNIVFGIEDAIFSIGNWPDVDLFNRVVTTLADSGPGSLRAAVSSLAGGPAGSTITFAPGLSGQTITLTSGKLLLTNSLTIDASALPGGIRISGNHSSRVFEVASNSTVVLNALAIVDGFSTSEGGGVRSSGTLTMNQCTLSGNTVSWDGGGLCVIEGTATLNACTVSGNTATQNSGGGLSNLGGLLTLNQCTITGNSAFGFGGGIDFGWDGGSVALNQCTLTGNSAGVGNPAGGYGGGIYHVGGSLDVYNSIVAGNTQTDGINVRGLVNYTGGSVIAGDPRLEPLGNYGGLTQTMPPRLDSPALDAGDDAATNRFSGDQRGMPRLRGTHMDVGAVELNYHVVTANSDSGPGSLRQLVSAALPHTALIFAGGMSNILLTSGPITLSNAITITIDASSLAGGMRISGNNNSRVFNVPSGSTVVLNALTITDGRASDTGGGILNNGTLTVNRCSLFGNNAASSGGAIASPAGTLTLNQCTLASNAVVALGTGGGAISFGSAGGTLTVNQSTLSGNVAPVGAGIYKGGGSLAVFNSIVAGNNQNSGNDIQGSGTYSGVNLTSGDPLLAPLGNYGGPTPTRPPLPGSPAIDAATNGPGFTIDQRGFPRVNGFYADLGAVEFPFGDVARWRMGEIDPGVADLAPLGGYTSNSVAGSPNLSVTGGSYSSSVAPEASTYARSRWSVYFNGFGVAPVVSTRTDNFGLELWVKPFASFTGTNCLAYNGRFDTDGWGIFRINNSYVATIGGLLNGAGTFGSKPATPSVWTHLALVRDNGISTFYVNGVPSGSIPYAAKTPSGAFGVAVAPNTGGAYSFNGSVDEVRVFTFAPGHFSTNDLLLVRDPPHLVTTTADSGYGSLRQAIQDLNTEGAPGGISFSVTGVISLLSDLPAISNSVAITGPGTNLLTISGANSFRLFRLAANSTNRIGGLKLVNGYTADDNSGAAIYNLGYTVLTDCQLVNNTVVGGLGGAVASFGTGTLLATNCTFANNNVRGGTGETVVGSSAGAGGGGAGMGGAIYTEGSVLTLSGCTFQSNVATGGNGGNAETGGLDYGGNGGFPNRGLNGGYKLPGNPGGFGGGGGGGFGGGDSSISTFGGAGGFGAGGAGGGGSWTPSSGGAGGAFAGGGRSGQSNPGFNSPDSGGSGGGGAGLGGAVFARTGAVSVVNCTFTGNLATNGLGGIGASGSGENGQGVGGAIFARDASLTLVSPTFSGNVASTTAANSFTPTTFVVTSLADSGAGTLRDLIGYANTNADANTIVFANSLSGQTITLTSGHITLSNSFTIDASSLAGGIKVNGNHNSRIFYAANGSAGTVDSVTLVNGSAASTNGGAVLNLGRLTFDHCSFATNSAVSGGTIYNDTGGNLTVQRCTLSGNQAGFEAGAIYNRATLSLIDTTVSGNTTPSSKVIIYNEFGVLNLANTIVAGNSGSAMADIENLGTLNFNGMNLVNTVLYWGVQNGPLPLSADPLLAPLGNYGGPTPTMPPMPGSLAIDTGTVQAFSSDQRGHPRPIGLLDIGAVEGVFNPSFSLVNVTKLGNGNVQFGFTNLSGPSYTVLATTNVAAPITTWSNLGTPAESPAGTFTFTDLQATNYPKRFYHVREP